MQGLETTIEAHGVRRTYGDGDDAVGLKALDLEVRAGEVVAVLGHNGAGKTTLVRGLATLLRFQQGPARVAGHDVATQARRVRERIALVGQGVAVDEQLSATRNLVLFGRLRGLDRAAARARAAALIDDFGLAESAHRPVGGFSGGMRRRLDVAASMIVRPDVLFVDEPTTGLDPAARRDLWGSLRRLVDEGTTVLLTTQYLEEADALADRIVLLAHGEAIAEGTSDDLKARLGRSAIHLRFDGSAAAERARPLLEAIDPEVDVRAGTTAMLRAHGAATLAECLRVLAAHDVEPSEASLRKPSLDDVFLSLTEGAELQEVQQ